MWGSLKLATIILYNVSYQHAPTYISNEIHHVIGQALIMTNISRRRECQYLCGMRVVFVAPMFPITHLFNQ